MTYDNAAPWYKATPLVVPDTLGEMIERVLDGKPDDFSFMFAVPPDALSRVLPCSFCDHPTLTVFLENHMEYDANVLTDTTGEMMVDVAPHVCPASQRHREFVRLAEQEEEEFQTESEE
jgi:hypothetical protein